MNKDKIREQIYNYNYEINGLVKLARELGNKKPYDNFLIKQRMEMIEKLYKQLKDMED